MSATIIKNNTDTFLTIEDLGITIPPRDVVNISKIIDEIDLVRSDDIIRLITSDQVIINDGFQDLDMSSALRHITGHTIAAVTDISGKIRVHQTSRKLGLRINWAGCGDSQESVSKIGGGQSFSVIHNIGEPDPEYMYIDYNIVENETWVHEGYVTWKNCYMDSITLEMVPRITLTQPGTSTNYNLYNGYMVIPAAGDGTIDLVEDITHPNNGLIFMPDGDLREKPTAFWNADYNSSTKHYENITPAPYGDGRYNMFSIEIVFARFLNSMPLLGDGFISLNSSDTDQLGHGMRLKMKANTCKLVEDHEWAVACLMCLHRQKSV
jgi:hypothetical protein